MRLTHLHLLVAVLVGVWSSDAHAHGVALVFPELIVASVLAGVVGGIVAGALGYNVGRLLLIGAAVCLLGVVAATFTNTPSVDGIGFFFALGVIQAFVPWLLAYLLAYYVIKMVRKMRASCRAAEKRGA
jgi:MFS family permease